MSALMPAAMAALTLGSGGAAAPLALAAGGVGAAGSIIGGVGQYNTAKANSATTTVEANDVMASADERAQQQQTQNERLAGEQVANAGASGVDPNQGSPLAARMDSASQGELARQIDLWQGASQAASLRQQGLIDKRQGNQALFGSAFTAGSTLLTAGVNYAKLSGGITIPGTYGDGPVSNVG